MLLTQRDVVLMNKAGPLEEEDQEPSAAQLANGDARDVEMSEEEKAMVAEADAAAAPVTTAAEEAAGRSAPQPLPEQPRQPEAAPTPQVLNKQAFAYRALLHLPHPAKGSLSQAWGMLTASRVALCLRSFPAA